MITLTKSAVTQLKKLLEDEKESSLAFRIAVEGGGCSGMRYAFSFDDAVADDDQVIEQDQVKVLVDPVSFAYIAGSEIDFKQSLMQSSFVINNPNVTAQCGCGSSFTA
jgi:iron-sulfur cluster insertion protein